MITKEEFEKAFSIVLEYQKQVTEEYQKVQNIGKITVNRNTPVIDLDLSVRLLNCLRASEINTISDLLSIDRKQLLNNRYFGKRSLEELENFIKELIII